jgi:catechol 2,3-dioxygenase-like lactoylglutathione lyase family enzyme
MAFVQSVPRSVEFYRRFGFEVGSSFTPPGAAEPSWAWLQSGGAHLMLARASEPVDPSQQAVLFYLYCDDVPAFRRALQDAGVEVGEIQYPFYCPRGEFRVTDPDGFALLVAHT